MNLSDYDKSISVEYTEDDIAKQAKLQESFDRCMRNAYKTKEEMVMQSIEESEVTNIKKPGI